MRAILASLSLLLALLTLSPAASAVSCDSVTLNEVQECVDDVVDTAQERAAELTDLVCDTLCYFDPCHDICNPGPPSRPVVDLVQWFVCELACA